MVSILILLDTGWKMEIRWYSFIGRKFQSSSYWIRAGRQDGCSITNSNGMVSILILLDTGWKSMIRPLVASFTGFNHLTGYGLEGKPALFFVSDSIHVSILILLDTGWKKKLHRLSKGNVRFQSSSYWIRAGRYRKIAGYPGSLCVSILILLDTGWKNGSGSGRNSVCMFQSSSYWIRAGSSPGTYEVTVVNGVSILILLDTGWKFAGYI